MVAWAIWSYRNEQRHGGVMKFATRIGTEALEYLAEYQECVDVPKQRREVQPEFSFSEIASACLTTQARMVGLSLGEEHFIQCGIAQDLRSDERYSLNAGKGFI
nr:hypothetical protein CFP56_44194 [Quercus suber]